MRSIRSKRRWLLTVAFSVAACTRQTSTEETQGNLNLTSEVAADIADQSAGARYSADQSENVVDINSWDLDGSVAWPSSGPTSYEASTSDEDVTDDQGQPDELWIGAVGGAADEKCTKTTGGHIGTTPYIPVKHGEATILSESDESVVLWTRRVDTGKDMKMVFGASQKLCEDARKRAERQPFPQE